jgi:TonB family protein
VAIEKCSASAGGAIGGSILQPLKLVDVHPVYPDALKGSRIGGVVTLQAVIGTDGAVQEVSVVDSPHPALDSAAVDAVRQWQFSSTLLNCTPVEVRMKVTITFIADPR